MITESQTIITTIIEILKFIWISIPLFITISIIWLCWIYKIAKKEKLSIKKYLKKELIDDKNTALAIYMGSIIFAVWVIISHTMALWIFGMLSFSFIWLWIQTLIMKLFEKTFWFNNFISYISDVQNTQIATLYAFIVITTSYLIGSAML